MPVIFASLIFAISLSLLPYVTDTDADTEDRPEPKLSLDPNSNRHPQRHPHRDRHCQSGPEKQQILDQKVHQVKDGRTNLGLGLVRGSESGSGSGLPCRVSKYQRSGESARTGY